MLDQLSKVAEATLGGSDAQPARFDLGQVAARAVEQARGRWPEHRLECEAAEGIEVIVDPRRIDELLAILLDNAAIYSEPGSRIDVRVGSEGRVSCVSIRDQGIGIPPDELESIFLCFKRASNVGKAGSAGTRGLGIGLYLARTITAEAGGRLWAESRLDHGSTFTLALPLAP
jgi:signal transduction histidine kinase